jgi:hypothetical protein
VLRLQPFQHEAFLQDCSVEANLVLCDSELQLQFRLQGPSDQLVCPEATAEPKRVDGLWQSTCLEAFFGVPGQRPYWEFNLSPSGDWNLYRLEDYRQGLAIETGIQVKGINSRRLELDSALILESEVCLDLKKAFEQLECSLTAVVALHHQGCSFWALKHCASEADFHRRESFSITAKQSAQD